MNPFGWDYPPDCHSLPWDNEEEDERCACARWLDRWLGTAQTCKQHWLSRGNRREVVGWTYTLTVLWVYHFYFYWRDSKQFSVKLSLFKAGQLCHPDEQETQLQLQVSTTFDWETLNRMIEVELGAVPAPIVEQCRQSDTETGVPRVVLWQHTLLLEEWQGYSKESTESSHSVYLIERRDQEGNTLNNVNVCSTLALVEAAIATYLKEGLEEYEDVGHWYFSVLEWTVDDVSPLCARRVQQRDRHNKRIDTLPVSKLQEGQP